MMATDTLNVIHRCAAGIDVHKMQFTATVRIARENADAQIHSQEFSALTGQTLTRPRSGSWLFPMGPIFRVKFGNPVGGGLACLWWRP